MEKLFCVIFGKYRKFEKPKISYLLEKTLVLENEDEKIFKEKESIENQLKILGLMNNIEEYQKI